MPKKNGPNQFKVLIVGSGGREHAIAWKLKQSRKVNRIFCAPGNGGMSQIARCVNIKAENIRGLSDFAHRNRINLTVVGPEQPLAMGIADEFHRRKLKVFGPDRKGAQLESSKVFSKQFMAKYHIPTAPFRVFESASEAIGFCKTLEYPAVIKADGLAAGKGVIVVKSLEEAEHAIEKIMVDKIFGKSGDRIIVESFLRGQELSVMALTDGKAIVPLLPSQDHKQAYEGDRGPNTGGMGAYCPAGFVDDALLEEVHDHVLTPTLAGLRLEKINYRGVLYAGLMITNRGVKVLEFNCRFGDPEAQAVLPLLKTDLLELLTRVVNRRLSSQKKVEWREGSAACVIMASKGYPGKYRTGKKISGLSDKEGRSSFVLHSGTRREKGQWFTTGGRVLGVVGMAGDLKHALNQAYSLVRRIRFDGATFRRDIGYRCLEDGKKEQK
ncbi:MAG: phosphoribosylamine--glycine ligase [Candidatus Zixiibacteriota bacterium]|nr:MAG: phosphoribosylamine--glycine ligase [candidate division Zixibacteria bacterium]